jgi:hypothetical protein
MSDLIKTNYMDSLVEQCKNIDTDESENWKDKSISTKVIDDQKFTFG